MLKTRYITIALMIMLALSISAFMAITLAYQQFPIGLRNLYELGTYLPAVEQLQTWFCATVLAFMALLPDMFVKVQCDWSEFATGNALISLSHLFSRYSVKTTTMPHRKWEKTKQ